MTLDAAIQRLFQAIESDDQDAALAALAAGIGVDVVDDSAEEGGYTPLQAAPRRLDTGEQCWR